MPRKRDLVPQSPLPAVPLRVGNYFADQFKAITGVLFRDYLRALRMAHATQVLLTTTTPITKLSFALGHTQPSNFVREFRSEIGIPPEVFRSRYKCAPELAEN
ncbi:MAG: helix-turn-helix transcriptional regulator [Acidobacteriaceae bacterium]|nr:helix-turn-helix transcriptional regulator [Acidobacteriaceae bacterium]